MKRFLLPFVAAALTASAAAPALSQPWFEGPRAWGGGGHLTTGYVDSLEWKINNAAREGRISWRYARQLRAQLRSVQNLAWRVETGQASGWEHRRLSETVSRIEAAVNRFSRFSQYDHEDDDDWDDQDDDGWRY